MTIFIVKRSSLAFEQKKEPNEPKSEQTSSNDRSFGFQRCSVIGHSDFGIPLYSQNNLA